MSFCFVVVQRYLPEAEHMTEHWIFADWSGFPLTRVMGHTKHIEWVTKDEYVIEPHYMPHGRSIQVYAAISRRGILGTIFHPADSRANSQYVTDTVLPAIQAAIRRKKKVGHPTETKLADGRRYRLYLDADSIHMSKHTQDWLAAHGLRAVPKDDVPIKLYESPIEEFWNDIKRTVYSGDERMNQETLEQRIREAFAGYPREKLEHLFDSIPDRVRNIIKEKGGHTKF
jgi:hypothetical protein